MFPPTVALLQATKQHLESAIERLTVAAADSRSEVVTLQATNLQLSLSAQSSDANAAAFRKQLDGLRANNQVDWMHVNRHAHAQMCSARENSF